MYALLRCAANMSTHLHVTQCVKIYVTLRKLSVMLTRLLRTLEYRTSYYYRNGVITEPC